MDITFQGSPYKCSSLPINAIPLFHIKHQKDYKNIKHLE